MLYGRTSINLSFFFFVFVFSNIIIKLPRSYPKHHEVNKKTANDFQGLRINTSVYWGLFAFNV